MHQKSQRKKLQRLLGKGGHDVTTYQEGLSFKPFCQLGSILSKKSPQLRAGILDLSLGHSRQSHGSDQNDLKRMCFLNVPVCPGNEI